MTAPIAITASYSDFKLVKSRSVAQILLELPIERAEEFVTAFGLPMPGSERPVALALMNDTRQSGEASGDASQPRQPRTDPASKQDKTVQRAAILCADQQFQKWLWAGEYHELTGLPNLTPLGWEDWAAKSVRDKCGIASRRELATNDIARAKWQALETSFAQATGRMAVDYRNQS